MGTLDLGGNQSEGVEDDNEKVVEENDSEIVEENGVNFFLGKPLVEGEEEVLLEVRVLEGLSHVFLENFLPVKVESEELLEEGVEFWGIVDVEEQPEGDELGHQKGLYQFLVEEVVLVTGNLPALPKGPEEQDQNRPPEDSVGYPRQDNIP